MLKCSDNYSEKKRKETLSANKHGVTSEKRVLVLEIAFENSDDEKIKSHESFAMPSEQNLAGKVNDATGWCPANEGDGTMEPCQANRRCCSEADLLDFIRSLRVQNMKGELLSQPRQSAIALSAGQS
jgi:hypothetical protein